MYRVRNHRGRREALRGFADGQNYCRSALASGWDCWLKDPALAALPLQWFKKWIFLFQRYNGKLMYRGRNRRGRGEALRGFAEGEINCRSALANGWVAAANDRL